MSDNPDSVPSPAKDPRPRPQFGELAPEGWTWEPPADKDRVDPAAPPLAGTAAGTPPLAPSPKPPPGPMPEGQTVPKTRTVAGWDRPWTLGLLIFGLLFTLYGAFSLGALSNNMQQVYTQMGIGTYVPPANVDSVTSVGAIALVFVWLAAAATSVRLLVQRRRSFYVPIIGGAVSIVLLFGFMMAAMLSDPNLIEFVSRQ